MSEKPVAVVPDDTLLAPWCPPGWRRSPVTGMPVMPVIGRLMFGEDAPAFAEIWQQCDAIDPSEISEDEFAERAWVLMRASLAGAYARRKNRQEVLGLAEESAIARIVSALCRLRGEVRIRRCGEGWEEVA